MVSTAAVSCTATSRAVPVSATKIVSRDIARELAGGVHPLFGGVAFQFTDRLQSLAMPLSECVNGLPFDGESGGQLSKD
jgi:hypothetical protein